MFKTKLITDFFSLFFPDLCNSCLAPMQNGEQVICTYCLFYLPRTGYHLRSDNPVLRLFRGRVEIEAAAAYYVFQKGGGVQQLLHRLKYSGKTEVGIELGKMYGTDLKRSALFSNVDLIIPVPLHSRKLKERGYNQSEYFAIGLARSMHTVVDADSLIRVSPTETQTRKSRFSRWKNVGNVFRLVNPQNLEDRHILLVDDVITTGATIEACALALQGAKNIRVSIAAIAIANS